MRVPKPCRVNLDGAPPDLVPDTLLLTHAIDWRLEPEHCQGGLVQTISMTHGFVAGIKDEEVFLKHLVDKSAALI